MAETQTESMELVKIDVLNAVQVFTGGGLNAILDKIESQVRAVQTDASTVAGREEIRSLAYRVTRTKTALDAEGKRLTEEWRRNTATVNAERKKAQERLEALAEEVRRPLTEFENKEKVRVAAHEEALRELGGLLQLIQPGGMLENATAAFLAEHLIDYSELHKDRNWEEFSDRARRVRAEVSAAMIGKIESRKKYEIEQAELARLRKEEAERLQRERDERLKAEAAEKARLEAERKAAEAAERERRRVEAEAEAERRRVAAEAEWVRLEHESERREAKAKAEAERKRAEALEQARLHAEKQAKNAEEARLASGRKAEADRIAAKEKASADLNAAREKAKRDAEAAAKRERESIETERKIAEAARLKREADEANKARIRAEIVADLLDWMTEENVVFDDLAVTLAKAIMNGQIRNVQVVW